MPANASAGASRTTEGEHMKTFLTIALLAVIASPTLSHIRHPGTQVAGNCQTICTYNPVTHQNICNTRCF